MKIEGGELALQTFKEFPIKADKVVKEAMRDASKVVVKDLKAKMPNKTFRKAVKSKIAEGADYTFANVGILRSKKDNLTWFKAYWKNFGTLANRDVSHKFVYPRKHISSKFKGGIKPSHFFESAIVGEDQRWKKEFTKSLEEKAKKRQLADGK